MQGDCSVLATSAPADVTTVATVVHDGVGSNSSDDDKIIRVDEGDRSYGSNRWPRQETLALLKIRSDMDSVFRDSSLKGPLWEEVSRKLAELGYRRSGKKCKEKFENVYKYHKRTKEGRTGKSDGKTYRFFDQLEAFESTHHQSHPGGAPPIQPQPPAAPPILQPQTQKPQPPSPIATATTTTLSWSNPPTICHTTVPSTTNHNFVITQTIDPNSPMPLSSSQPLNSFPTSLQNLTSHLFSSSSTSSSTASDEEIQGTRKRKRRWKDFFERLTKDVIKKQEELQRKFLETIEKREHERMAREESWRKQEMARINREHEILIQERAAAAAKDAAIVTFLQKISGHQISVQTLDIPPPLPPLSAPGPALSPVPAPQALSPAPVSVLTPVQQPRPLPAPAPAPQALSPAPVSVLIPVQQPRPPPAPAPAPVPVLNPSVNVEGKDNTIGSSSSRWPKVEVEALIRLRTRLDTKYQENAPKGPLWEEISAGMQKLGYKRSAKRCKEKWENINKYFKKVKESNKKRPQDSKTCPYFHHLDALYKEKGKTNDNNNSSMNLMSAMEPLLVRPEQQWPLQQDSHNLELNGREKNEEEEEEEEVDDEIETEEEDEGGGEFQVVATKPAGE